MGPVVEKIATLPERKAVLLRTERLQGVLGIRLDESAIAQLFNQLHFSYRKIATGFEVTPPNYRFDITIEEDLIEEIARLHGYDNIPAILPHVDSRMLPASETDISRTFLRDCLAANGYQEVINYSFVNETWEKDLLGNAHPIPLKNPIASNMSVMRSGLWGGLLDTLVYNLNRKQEHLRLFEIGVTYAKNGDGYQETSRISGLAYGNAAPEQWADAAREIDFYDIKADVLSLTSDATFIPAPHPALHPGQSAQILLDAEVIGWLGKLHPKWQQHYQLPRSTLLFELDTAPLLKRKLAKYQELPKFPPVRRDMAVVVDENVTVQSLLDTMLNAQLTLVSEVALFDIYRGNGVPEKQKKPCISCAYARYSKNFDGRRSRCSHG